MSFARFYGNLSIAIAGAIGGDASGLSTTLAQSTNDTLFSGLAVLDWTNTSKTVSDVVHKEQLCNTLSPHTRGPAESRARPVLREC